ncbi:MAG TPA: ATP-binding cassette domain-containing protein [Polyangiaceae bacterium]|nr:ATP-binding cassette domain-containing protein [Polyangiaceae bacterium]
MVSFRRVRYRAPGGRVVLPDLSFDLGRGEALALLGESGCGKTTTLRLVNRLLSPESGEVLFDGRPATSWDPIALRRKVGYVMQGFGLFPHYSVRENVATVPSLEGWPRDAVDARVDELLALVGLDPAEFGPRLPDELSGGQRQRVGFARALAVRPPLVLLDEPFGALDPLTRAALRREFCALRRELGLSALFVTHDVLEALEVGTRVGLMHGGELVLLATPDEFLASDHPRARAYLDTLPSFRAGAPAAGRRGGGERGAP